jgi:PKD repeat protein
MLFRFGIVLGIAAMLVALHTQPSASAERANDAFPALALPEGELAGSRAITALGGKLPKVAEFYGLSATQLRSKLLRDPTLKVDQAGRVFVVEPMVKPGPFRSLSSARSGWAEGELAPLDQTFRLNSRPGATRTIALVFRGMRLENTGWNDKLKVINARPFDFDGNPSRFSNDELRTIQLTWQRVAEDFAPFDVNVTTEEVSSDRINRRDANDQVYGTRVLITRNWGMNCGCAGIAYVGGFFSGEFWQPALVFIEGSNDKNIAEVISHEVGHNLGLWHDGSPAGEYYAGWSGDTHPVTGWAPIMGLGYSKPLTQFSKGEYAGPTNRQDDFAEIQAQGLPLRPDEAGNSVAEAVPFPGVAAGSTVSGRVDGVIASAADRDVYALRLLPGPLRAEVRAAARGANADLVLSVLDQAGVVIASSNPDQDINAAINHAIAQAGTYYLEVKGTGRGDPMTSGYTSYGSVGAFRLSASYTAEDTVPPVASFTASTTSGPAPLAVTLDARASADGDRPVSTYVWDFGDGTGDTTGTLQIARKTYATPGTYTVSLRVTDAAGLSGATTRTIAVQPGVAQRSPTVSSLAVRLNVRGGTASGHASLRLLDQSGAPLRGAKVLGSWSGLISAAASGTTNGTGHLVLTSRAAGGAGCFTININSVRLNGITHTLASPAMAQACR